MGRNGNEKLSGPETVLLVEDEEIVRTLVREVLTSNGYRVLEADGGSRNLNLRKLLGTDSHAAHRCDHAENEWERTKGPGH